jgi:ubiquinone/menaquinone biosynthesis C-methylase UbiE
MDDSHSLEARYLDLAKRYDLDCAQQYFVKHRKGLFHRVSMWRERAMARRALALAGDPQVVLDLPCGAGRFWTLLAEKPKRRILAADGSEEMLHVARQMQPKDLVERVESFQCSAFTTGLADDSVDSVFCMRLLHHIPESSHRVALLREFHRVTRETVCISLWIDGNYKAYRRRQREVRRPRGNHGSRYVANRRSIESEFQEAGFRIEGRVDFLRFYSMWRIYVLRKG